MSEPTRLDPVELDRWITGDWPEPERDVWPFLPLDDEPVDEE